MVPDIDFTSAAMAHRLRQGGGRGQALAKAVGAAKGRTPRIIDATAGLGRDGFILAHLGADIIMIERNPAIHGALQQALQSALAGEDIFAAAAARIELIFGDAKTVLPSLTGDTIYIDPMHPARHKSALVKQNMRDLRAIVGPDTDCHELIHAALQHTSKRISLKWPKNAALPQDIPKPSYERIGKTTRYCIFIR